MVRIEKRSKSDRRRDRPMATISCPVVVRGILRLGG